MRSSMMILACLVAATACSGGEQGRKTPIYGTSGSGSSTTTDSGEEDTGLDDEASEDSETGSTSGGDGETTTESGGEAVCGNGIKEVGEECDGSDVAGLSCLDFGHDNGSLICADDCTLFTNACSTCGDGQLAATEACDGTNFGGLTCTDLGYAGGTLTCAGDCSQFFENGCMASQSCGNGLIDGSEQCDGGNLNGQTCAGLGFSGGTLGCANCVYDASGCTNDEQMCVPLLGECNILLQNCCPGLTCGLLICVPE